MMTLIPYNKGQPIGVHPEMSEFYEIFRVISKGLVHHNASGDPRYGSQVRTGRRRVRSRPGQGALDQGHGPDRHWGTRVFREPVQVNQGENVPDPDGKDDSENDSCVEIQGDEEWMRYYEKMSEAATWSGDITDPADGH